MGKRVFFLFVFIGMMVSCGGIRREMLNGELTRAEDTRNPAALMSIVEKLMPADREAAIHGALAAGRIPAFAAWKELAKRFGHDGEVARALAVAIRFPETNFPRGETLDILRKFPVSKDVVISLLALDTPDAFRAAMSHPGFDKVVAANLWRSRHCILPEDVVAAYRVHPAETVYSAYRMKLKGIVRSKDLKTMGVFQKVYGIAVCDTPSDFLSDPDWRVRVAALKGDDSRKGAVRLLEDKNPLVRVTALEIYLKNGGTVWRKAKHPMTPMEVETLLRVSDKGELALPFFERGGRWAEVSAPYMPELKKALVLASAVSDSAKIVFLEHRFGEGRALAWAESQFNKTGSPAALQYLLDKLPDVAKVPFVVKAKKIGGTLLSVLDDFGFKPLPESGVPLAVYLDFLKKAARLKGFNIKTEKGEIHCRFFPSAAPLTCLNFAKLAEKGYFNHSSFHRVVPAFVTQDGDPTGTGSGGPGYSIRCEYNELDYDRAGRVGMALAGKDTGGSQFFLTHLPTPHLDQQYTIFAQLTGGMDVLSRLEQMDKINRITVDEKTGTH